MAMTLSEFMKSRSLTDARFAELLDCSEGALRKWRYGERTPRSDQMRRIMEVTGGLVTPNDFLLSSPSTEGEAA